MGHKNRALSSSLEDYLEVILQLVEENSVARVKDIADRLNVKRSSVTIALRNLSERALVNYEPYSVITLTPAGQSVAECVERRHNLLNKFFLKFLKVDSVTASEAACEMEHGMKPGIYRRFETLMDTIEGDKEIFDKIISAIDKIDNEKCGENGCSCEASGARDAQLPLLLDINVCASGDEGVVRKLLGSGASKRRYMEMGITVGQPIKLIKAAPLDDPIEIQVRNYRLSLRRGEAENILIERSSK
jgi:DtxR family Mn-dependent transcriptional regulator